jgi:hypothetical protein
MRESGLQATGFEVPGSLGGEIRHDSADEFRVTLQVLKHTRMFAAQGCRSHGARMLGDCSRCPDCDQAVDNVNFGETGRYTVPLRR